MASLLFAHLGATSPVVTAPMAGGPSTPALVAAAASVGSLGFLAGGYKTAEALAEHIEQTRAQTERFAVNLFAPNPLPVDAGQFLSYARAIQPAADRFGLDLARSEPLEDDDHWAAKLDLLLARPVPVVSFTFGLPDRGVVGAFRQAGTMVLQTVTSLDEARQAGEIGVDGLVVQSHEAGAHYGTFTPERLPVPLPLEELLSGVRAELPGLPLIAAGGVATPARVRSAMAAGAAAVMVGSVLLRTNESGANATYRQALADRRDQATVVTRAWTGRPARGLANSFTDRYDSIAPLGYPALHHLTVGLRRAAAAAGDAEYVNLWAGTGFGHATDEPAEAVISRLSEGG